MDKINVNLEEQEIVKYLLENKRINAGKTAVILHCSVAKGYQVLQKLDAKGVVVRSYGWIEINPLYLQRIKKAFNYKEEDLNGDRIGERSGISQEATETGEEVKETG